MQAKLTNFFRTQASQSFKDLITSETVYLAIGQIVSWPTTPPDADISQDGIQSVWDEMIGAKRIQAADTSICVDRIDWVSGTIYPQWSSTEEIIDWYVLTDERNVYVCMNNNSGIPSTTKPTGTSTATFTTPDGYQWKYMYTIDVTRFEKFVTPELMPVFTANIGDATPQAAVQAAANGGLGANAVYDLGGNTLSISTKFEYDEGGTITVQNHFCQISVVMNPLAYGTTTEYTATTARQTLRLSVDTTVGFVLDEEVLGNLNGATGKVVELDSTNNYIFLSDVAGEFSTAEIVSGASASASISGVNNPDFEPYSGQVLYVENIEPQLRDIEKTERVVVSIAW